MKVVVTGGCGFIGSNLVDRLVKEGYGVNVIDNESSDAHDHFFYNDVARYHKVDISDYDSIRHIFQNAHCVFHLAAESRIMNTIENPTLAIQTNVLGTANVLQAAKEMQAYEHQLFLDNESKVQKQLQDQGMIFVEVDKTAFMENGEKAVYESLSTELQQIYKTIKIITQ